MTAEVSNAVAALYLIVIFGIFLVPAAVLLAKAHIAVFVLGLLTMGLVWIVACWRLARPRSWWAKRFYGAEKLQRAHARYG
jgi:hypothetical protein